MEKQAKMLERVRALMAKADSTEHQAEADAFRAKADELMTAWSIAQWQVEDAQDKATTFERPKPEVRDWDISWYVTSPVGDVVYQMFHGLALHCRCRAVSQKGYVTTPPRTKGWKPEPGRRYGMVPVVGLPADLDYLDMLFTSLHLELARKITPRPNSQLDRMENIVMLKEAGMSWPEIARAMVDAGIVAEDEEGSFIRTRDKMTRDYRKWCKDTGHAQSYNNHLTYRRSFAGGFWTGVREQLKNQEEVREATTGMELVVTGTREAIDGFIKEQYPDLRPARYTRDTRKENWAARSAGHQAGLKANVAVHTSRRFSGSPKQIEG